MLTKASPELDYLALKYPSISSKWIMKARSSYLVRQLDLLDYVTMESYKSILQGFKLCASGQTTGVEPVSVQWETTASHRLV